MSYSNDKGAVPQITSAPLETFFPRCRSIDTVWTISKGLPCARDMKSIAINRRAESAEEKDIGGCAGKLLALSGQPQKPIQGNYPMVAIFYCLVVFLSKRYRVEIHTIRAIGL
jgi:hypothetical protein